MNVSYEVVPSDFRFIECIREGQLRVDVALEPNLEGLLDVCNPHLKLLLDCFINYLMEVNIGYVHVIQKQQEMAEHLAKFLTSILQVRFAFEFFDFKKSLPNGEDSTEASAEPA